MSTHIDALRLRAVMGRDYWTAPKPYGPDGWRMRSLDEQASIIVTAADHDDGTWWVHASIARENMPTYEDLQTLHRAAFGDGWAYEVFAPRSHHVNLHEHARHLWGRLDGKPALPIFNAEFPGSI